MIDRLTKVGIVETQQESEIDDEILFTLFVNGKTVSWAKTIQYSNLEDIRTVCIEKRKGYGKLLLTFIEKRAQSHCATSMRTNDFKVHNVEATDFFKSMFYTISPSTSSFNDSVNASKIFKEQ